MTTVNIEREQLLEFVVRMREAEEAAQKDPNAIQRAYWSGRSRAYDEVYTELKGSGFGERS
jgi:uncharacterized protein (UPF0335 family)